MDENKSEIARLLRQIDQELEACQRGLLGLAAGTAQHTFIHTKMERVEKIEGQLADYVGKTRATRMMVERYINIFG